MVKKLMLGIIPAFILFSCGNDDDGVSANGPIITTEVQLGEFSAFELEGVGDVTIVTDDFNSVQITTHENIVDLVTVGITEDKLSIGLSQNVRDVEELSFTVYTSGPLDLVELTGVGNISYPGPVSSLDFAVMLDGVGNITVGGLTSSNVTARLKDVGNISLSGTTASLDYLLEGVGDISGFGLVGEVGDVTLQGVGNIQVHASDTLIVSHNGVGQIQYRGQPIIVGDTENVVQNN